MIVSDALSKRKSTRAFLNDAVPIDLINKILEQSLQAPSGDNHQPWEVAIVTGRKKLDICNKLENAFLSGRPPAMDYEYYPQYKKSEKETNWFGRYKENRKACGIALYSQLGITREMKQRKENLYALNYRSFNAPVMLLFFIDKELGKGSYVDYGMFIQSIMLSAVEHGLATCPQGSLGEYGDIIRQELPKYKDKIVLCGMSIGYEDTNKTINKYRTTRHNLKEMVTHYGSN
jgi:nitroreductase